MKRTTIEKEITLKGVGLHTGEPCEITFKPAQDGIIFLRKDMPSLPIKACLANVVSTMRGTNLANAAAQVHTVEHVLSAANGLNISDLIVEMTGPEPPIMDGSSLPYAQALVEASLKEIDGEQPSVSVSKKLEYKEGDIVYTAEPSGSFKITFVFVREHPLVGRQQCSVEMTPKNYLKEIAPARTFGFEEELAYLRAKGLARGGSIHNCVVVQKDAYSVPLRFEDELVRHKILDIVGDLKLLCGKIEHTHITCAMGGHKSNINFAKILESVQN